MTPVKELLRKLLALAESSNQPGEVRNARAKAERLARKHNIDLSKIQATTPSDSERFNIGQLLLKRRKLRFHDKLAVEVCKFIFGVEMRGLPTPLGFRIIVLAPKPAEPQSAIAGYLMTVRAMESAWTQHKESPGIYRFFPFRRQPPCARSFYSGMYRGICDRANFEEFQRGKMSKSDFAASLESPLPSRMLPAPEPQPEPEPEPQPFIPEPRNPLALVLKLETHPNRSSEPEPEPEARKQPTLNESSYRAGYQCGTQIRIK